MAIKRLMIYMRYTRYLLTMLAVCIVAAIGTSSVLADEQRVLIRFDDSGHQVKNVWQTGANTGKIKEPLARSSQTMPFDAAALSYPEPGSALVVWLDSQHVELLRSFEPDPRLSHAPSHINGAGQSRIGGREGAWLITGPVLAVSVYIMLPADLSVGLGPERWELALAGN